MPNRQGKQIVVEGYVKAAHGKAQRDWPFIACSDSPFTEVFSPFSHPIPILRRH